MKRVLEERIYDEKDNLITQSRYVDSNFLCDECDDCDCEEDPFWMSTAIAEIYHDGEKIQQKLKKLYNSVCDEEASDES